MPSRECKSVYKNPVLRGCTVLSFRKFDAEERHYVSIPPAKGKPLALRHRPISRAPLDVTRTADCVTNDVFPETSETTTDHRDHAPPDCVTSTQKVVLLSETRKVEKKDTPRVIPSGIKAVTVLRNGISLLLPSSQNGIMKTTVGHRTRPSGITLLIFDTFRSWWSSWPCAPAPRPRRRRRPRNVVSSVKASPWEPRHWELEDSPQD